MKPRARWSTLLLSLALWLAPAQRALAAEEAAPPLALHPCVVVGEKNPEQARNHQLACTTVLVPANVRRVPDEQVTAFLDKEPRKTCAPPAAKKTNECLARLATATQAARAVLITITPGQVTRVSGLVVGAEGEVIDQKSIQLRSRGQSQDELLRTALARLKDQLNLLPAKSVTAAPEPTPTPPPAPPAVASTPPPDAPSAAPSPDALLTATPPAPRERSPLLGQSWKTPVAYSAAGVGLVAMGLAGYLALSGDQAMRQSNLPFANNGYPLVTEVDSVLALRAEASRKRTFAGIGAAAGAVLLGTGAYLWFTDRPRAATPGLSGVSVGPGGVSVSGVLP